MGGGANSVNWWLGVLLTVASVAITWIVRGLVGWSNEKGAIGEKIAGVKMTVAVIENKVDTTQKSIDSLQGEFRSAVSDLKSEMRQYFKDERERVDRQIDSVRKGRGKDE